MCRCAAYGNRAGGTTQGSQQRYVGRGSSELRFAICSRLFKPCERGPITPSTGDAPTSIRLLRTRSEVEVTAARA
jgi:hypothetical protein